MRRAFVLSALAGVALVAALLTPATGWLVALHLGGLRGATLREALETSLDPLPISSATGIASGLRRIGKEALPRVPNRWRIHRNAPKDDDPEDPAPDPERVRELLALATSGETLEPDNGYFAAMAAVGRFAQGQTKEGLAALHRAATAPTWDDHRTEAVRWQIAAREARGRLPAVALALIDASVAPWSTNERLRRVASAAILEAQRREAAGDAAGGMTIRRDLLTLSRRLIEDSRSIAGVQAGGSLIRIAAAHPGTERAIEDDVEGRRAQWRRWAKTQGATDLVDLPVRLAASAEAKTNLFPRAVEGITGLAGTSLLAGNVLSVTPLAIALTLLGLSGVVTVARRTQGRPWRIPLVVVLSLALVGALYAFAQAGVSITALASNLLRAEDGPNATTLAGVLGQYLAVFAHVLGIALGALSVVVVLIVALTKSARKGSFADAFVACAAPGACVALVVYAALLPFVAAKDTTARNDAFRMIDDEISYLKSIPGEWQSDDGEQRDGS